MQGQQTWEDPALSPSEWPVTPQETDTLGQAWAGRGSTADMGLALAPARPVEPESGFWFRGVRPQVPSESLDVPVTTSTLRWVPVE